ncbi:hypothetical protein [Neptuniibacter sp. QD37_11]|uniref:hypothetical protein n=1 Tax=Neptuniibacter sp. QD37_11 TaxID=3398209 RepID=UPI0039F4ADEA
MTQAVLKTVVEVFVRSGQGIILNCVDGDDVVARIDELKYEHDVVAYTAYPASDWKNIYFQARLRAYNQSRELVTAA